MSKVTAVLLAGGVGKRFWPMTQAKSLLLFLNKPLITHTALALRNAGITNVVVVANRQNQKALQELKLGTVVVQKSPLGMGDAMLAARTHIKGSSILVANAADIVDQKLYEKILEKARKTNADIIIPGLERKEYFPGGYQFLHGLGHEVRLEMGVPLSHQGTGMSEQFLDYVQIHAIHYELRSEVVP